MYTILREKILIILVFGFLTGCGNSSVISDIDQYVAIADESSDLKESITKYNAEDFNSDIINNMTYYELRDSEDKIYRIITDLITVDEIPYYYEFYYKNSDVVFSRIVELSKSGSDTLMNSRYYFSDSKLIKQIDQKEKNMESETVKQLSEFYFVFGNDRID